MVVSSPVGVRRCASRLVILPDALLLAITKEANSSLIARETFSIIRIVGVWQLVPGSINTSLIHKLCSASGIEGLGLMRPTRAVVKLFFLDKASTHAAPSSALPIHTPRIHPEGYHLHKSVRGLHFAQPCGCLQTGRRHRLYRADLFCGLDCSIFRQRMRRICDSLRKRHSTRFITRCCHKKEPFPLTTSILLKPSLNW
jgi:hypothetical protein